MEGFLSSGNQADITHTNDLTQNITGFYVIEDKGYDSDKHREGLILNQNTPVIPGRKNRTVPIIYDKNKFKMRDKNTQKGEEKIIRESLRKVEKFHKMKTNGGERGIRTLDTDLTRITV